MSNQMVAPSQHNERQQQVLSCNNEEALQVLLGLEQPNKNKLTSSTRAKKRGLPSQSTSQVQSVEASFRNQEKDDNNFSDQQSSQSSAMEEEALFMHHEQILKQLEFEHQKRNGFIGGMPQNQFESGQVNLATPPQQTHHPIFSQNSPHPQTPQQQQQDVQQILGMSEAQNYNQQIAGQFNDLQASNFGKNQRNSHNQLLGGNFGGNTSLQGLRQQGGSLSRGGKKRGRPTSAYPAPIETFGFKRPSEYNLLGENSNQQSQLTRFTINKARANESKKQYIPHNIATFEKEKLYEEKMSLKQQRNDMLQQCTMFRTQVKALETDLKKKDIIIGKLTADLRASNHNQPSAATLMTQHSSAAGVGGGIMGSTFSLIQGGSAAGLVVQGQPNFYGVNQNTHSVASSHKSGKNASAAGSTSTLKQLQSQKQITELKQRLKNVKCDLTLKETEVQNLQRTLKFTKIREFEIELQAYMKEIDRLRGLLIQETQKPKVSLAQFQALQNQMQNEQLKSAQLLQKAQNLEQDNQKLSDSNQGYKARMTGLKQKCKKFAAQNRRYESKFRMIEIQNYAQSKKQQLSAASFVQDRGNTSSSVGVRKKSRKGGANGIGQQSNEPATNQETQQQLQMQLEINQILIDKLEECGVDVRDLINQQAQQLNQNYQDGNKSADVRSVVFTFMGPKGLIEGGDNQQFEMPLDLGLTKSVSDIQTLLKKELVMDKGIDLVLKNQTSGTKLANERDIREAVENQMGILVEFIEDQDKMKVDEQNSEYSDDQFEQEEKDEEKVEENLPKIDINQIKQALVDLRLILMIKKVPRTHMVGYILGDLEQIVDENGQIKISCKELALSFQRMFSFSQKRATKVARYLTEQDVETDQICKSENFSISKDKLISDLRDLVPDYSLYNGFAITGMLSRLQSILEDKLEDFLEDLNLEDEDSENYLPMVKIMHVWRVSGLPTLDEDLAEFVNFMALRDSLTLKRVNYREFCKIFNEDYLLGPCVHDDEPAAFQADEEKDDESYLTKYHAAQNLNKQTDEEQIRNEGEGGNFGGEQTNEDWAPGEIEQDELMLKIDDALSKIREKLPSKHCKHTLNQILLPHVSQQIQPKTQERILTIQPQVFVNLLVQEIGVQFDQQQLYCLLHVLVREQEDQQPGANANNEYIIYSDVYALMRNFLRKEKILYKSQAIGLDYRVLDKATFEFFLRLKQAVSDQQYPGLSANSAGHTFRQALVDIVEEKQILVGQNQGVQSLEVVEFDNFFDAIFMKFKLVSPGHAGIEQLRYLLGAQLGSHATQVYFLVSRIERVLSDLDYIYVNIVKMIRSKEHSALQKEAMDMLKQRYDFISNSLSMQQASSIVSRIDYSQKRTTSAKNKKKARPASSKPKRQVKNKIQEIADEIEDIELDQADLGNFQKNSQPNSSNQAYQPAHPHPKQSFQVFDEIAEDLEDINEEPQMPIHSQQKPDNFEVEYPADEVIEEDQDEMQQPVEDDSAQFMDQGGKRGRANNQQNQQQQLRQVHANGFANFGKNKLKNEEKKEQHKLMNLNQKSEEEIIGQPAAADEDNQQQIVDDVMDDEYSMPEDDVQDHDNDTEAHVRKGKGHGNGNDIGEKKLEAKTELEKLREAAKQISSDEDLDQDQDQNQEGQEGMDDESGYSDDEFEQVKSSKGAPKLRSDPSDPIQDEYD